MHWRHTRWFFAATASTCGAVAIGFFLLGLWPILPFAGVELGALWLAFYVTAVDAQRAEIILVTRQSVRIEKGRRGPERVWIFPRVWATVLLTHNGHRNHPSRLSIGAHGRRVELGRFLSDDERREVARDLRYKMSALC